MVTRRRSRTCSLHASCKGQEQVGFVCSRGTQHGPKATLGSSCWQTGPPHPRMGCWGEQGETWADRHLWVLAQRALSRGKGRVPLPHTCQQFPAGPRIQVQAGACRRRNGENAPGCSFWARGQPPASRGGGQTPRDLLTPTNSGRLSLSGAAGTDGDSTALSGSSQFSSLPALSFSQR